jgi:hypothetical protein
MLPIHKDVPSSLLSEEGFESLKAELDAKIGKKFVIVRRAVNYSLRFYDDPQETYEITQYSGLMTPEWKAQYQVGEPMLYSEAVALIRILEGGNYE